MKATGTTPWWRDAVFYHVYVRSFQDSNADGIGDLRGVVERLDHIVDLGVDAVWLSPIHPSPLADLGYDITDHTGIDPALGGRQDFDDLVGACHSRGLRLLLDLVASHTSIEHPWFREHPERYIWSDGGPANNWRSAFGGPAWSRDELTGRWYLHSFFPEQPDLNWRNPDVPNAIGEVVRHWLARGVDGYRVDAVQQLVKDAELRDDPPATHRFPLPLHEERARLRQLHSGNDPETAIALRALRRAAGRALLVGEVYLPSESLLAYLDELDLAFAFEFLHAPWEAGPLREIIETASRIGRMAWVLSSHDFPRLATRIGEANARAAAMLLLTLPGPAFVYQGEEIGMLDGPGAEPPIDRAGRDGARHPMQWDAGPNGGFTSGVPWLAVTDPGERNVADQEAEPGSMLNLYRRLIALRRTLRGGFRFVESAPPVLAYERGELLVAINLSDEAQPAPGPGEVVLAAGEQIEGRAERLPPRTGAVLSPG